MSRPARLPVVDGDTGADVYGFATTARGALRIARRDFCDPIARVEVVENVQLREGGTVARAWLALTIYGAGLA